MQSMTNADDFLTGYMVAALWSTNDESRPDGGDPLDDNYSTDDIAAETVEAMRKDCEAFIQANQTDLDAYHAAGRDAEHAGHDFWLTRNGHGVGFWDRGLGELGERLSRASKTFGSVDLYVHDGKVHS